MFWNSRLRVSKILSEHGTDHFELISDATRLVFVGIAYDNKVRATQLDPGLRTCEADILSSQEADNKHRQTYAALRPGCYRGDLAVALKPKSLAPEKPGRKCAESTVVPARAIVAGNSSDGISC